LPKARATVKGLIATRWRKTPTVVYRFRSRSRPTPRHHLYSKTINRKYHHHGIGQTRVAGKTRCQKSGVLAVSEEGASIKCLAGAGDYQFYEALRISNKMVFPPQLKLVEVRFGRSTILMLALATAPLSARRMNRLTKIPIYPWISGWPICWDA